MKRNLSDKELTKELSVDEKTLARFRQIQKDTIAEAKKRFAKKGGKIRVLGISGSMRDEYDYAQESSNSEFLLEKCLAFCKKYGADTELIKLRKFSIKPCKACYSTTNTQCHFYCTCYAKGTPEEDDMSKILYDKVLGADAIIFATPTNNFAVSTLTKAFLDRCISLDGSLPPANPKSPKDRALNIKHMKFVELTADSNVAGSGMFKRFSGKVAGIIATGHEEGASMAISQLYMTLTHYGMLFPPYSNMYAMSNVCLSTYKDKPQVTSECYIEEARLLALNLMEAAKIVSSKKGAWAHDEASN